MCGVQRAGAVLGLVRDVDADNAHFLAGHVLHHIGLDVIVNGGRGEGCADLGHYVGCQYRRLATAAGQEIQELLQAFVATVELVIAQRKGVETHQVHQLGIGFALVGGEVERAGNGVAGVQFQHVIQGHLSFCDLGGNTRETTGGELGFLPGDGQGLRAAFKV